MKIRAALNLVMIVRSGGEGDEREIFGRYFSRGGVGVKVVGNAVWIGQ